jgi:hypothetical protein
MISLGTTFSHRFAEYLSLDSTQSLHTIIALKFDIIRLCCYWDEIQKDSKTYDFTKIKHLLDICEIQNQNVILTLGMKAPRSPEFYIPAWTHSKDPKIVLPDTLRFIEETISQLQKYSCIKYWQVENEPIDPVWPSKQFISFDDLRQEVSLVRKLDKSRKIIINLWGNGDSVQKNIKQIEDITDVIGIDLYYKQYIQNPLNADIYTGPKLSHNSLKKLISSAKKPVWITELQAEPWEKSNDNYKSENPKSISPELLEKNFSNAKSLNPEAVLFWGSEYWLWRKKHGDKRYFNLIKDLI